MQILKSWANGYGLKKAVMSIGNYKSSLVSAMFHAKRHGKIKAEQEHLEP